MTYGREGQKIWLDVYPFEEDLCHNLAPETPLFVDIGGGIGVQCMTLRNRFPRTPGRIILQDLSQTLEHAMAGEGFEKMVYDFWTPQPIKGKLLLWLSRSPLNTKRCESVLHAQYHA